MQPGNQYGCSSEERERRRGVRHWCVPPSLPLHRGYSVIISGAVSAEMLAWLGWQRAGFVCLSGSGQVKPGCGERGEQERDAPR